MRYSNLQNWMFQILVEWPHPTSTHSFQCGILIYRTECSRYLSNDLTLPVLFLMFLKLYINPRSNWEHNRIWLVAWCNGARSLRGCLDADHKKPRHACGRVWLATVGGGGIASLCGENTACGSENTVCRFCGCLAWMLNQTTPMKVWWATLCHTWRSVVANRTRPNSPAFAPNPR